MTTGKQSGAPMKLYFPSHYVHLVTAQEEL